MQKENCSKLHTFQRVTDIHYTVMKYTVYNNKNITTLMNPNYTNTWQWANRCSSLVDKSSQYRYPCNFGFDWLGFHKRCLKDCIPSVNNCFFNAMLKSNHIAIWRKQWPIRSTVYAPGCIHIWKKKNRCVLMTVLFQSYLETSDVFQQTIAYILLDLTSRATYLFNCKRSNRYFYSIISCKYMSKYKYLYTYM